MLAIMVVMAKQKSKKNKTIITNQLQANNSIVIFHFISLKRCIMNKEESSKNNFIGTRAPK